MQAAVDSARGGTIAPATTSKGGKTLRKMRQHWQLYLLILPALIYFLIFAYFPLYGLQLAFKDFQVFKGMAASPWVGLDHFEDLFSSPKFPQLLRNTLLISLYRLVFGFPVPNDHPYEVIDETLQIMNRQREGLRPVIRPWIQDLGYGSFAPYTAAQVLAEMAAARDNGAQGWMIWNARATFTESALGAPREGEDAGPTTASGGDATPSAEPSAITAR